MKIVFSDIEKFIAKEISILILGSCSFVLAVTGYWKIGIAVFILHIINIGCFIKE